MRVIIPLHPDTLRAWVDLLVRFNHEHHTLFIVSVLFVLSSLCVVSYKAIQRGFRGD